MYILYAYMEAEKVINTTMYDMYASYLNAIHVRLSRIDFWKLLIN